MLDRVGVPALIVAEVIVQMTTERAVANDFDIVGIEFLAGVDVERDHMMAEEIFRRTTARAIWMSGDQPTLQRGPTRRSRCCGAAAFRRIARHFSNFHGFVGGCVGHSDQRVATELAKRIGALCGRELVPSGPAGVAAPSAIECEAPTVGTGEDQRAV